MTDILLEVEKPALKTNLPDFAPGDAIRVHVKVREGEKERIQIFAGVVIARRGGGARETFTVRAANESRLLPRRLFVRGFHRLAPVDLVIAKDRNFLRDSRRGRYEQQ